MTERLYYQDPCLRVFDASVVERREVGGQPAVVLDVTAFYPTGGGQSHDTGTLGGVRVLDVHVADDGQIVHLLDGPVTASEVRGEVDWERRFDHMQQHTGQHVLSQAFVQTCRAETVGFHLGEEVSTLDLDRAPLSVTQAEEAERLANEVVMSGRPVIARFVDEGALAEIPVRKMPAVTGPVRVVEVSQFDWSACGGTHVSNSGQVGPIKVTRIERRRAETRIHFLCGWRALSDYARKRGVVGSLTTYLTTSEDEILPSVQRVEAEVKELRKKLATAQTQLLDYEVEDWVKGAESVGQVRVVRRAFEDRDLSVVKEAARRLVEQPGVVALLAVRRPRVQFVFARSEGLSADMGSLMRAACAAVGGRGGGRPQYAQGGAPEGGSADEALNEALERLKDAQAGRKA